MGDSWEDEDEDLDARLAQAAPIAAAAADNWDDEEDTVEIDAQLKAVKLTKEQVAVNEKKLRDIEQAQINKLKTEALKKETPEERKKRERRAAEESDNALAGELFGFAASAGASASVSSRSEVVILKTKQDHSAYGNKIVQNLAASSAFNIAAFYKSLAKTCDIPNMTSEVLNEIIGDLEKIRAKKLEKEKPQAKVMLANKKSKSALKKEAQKHTDVFGGNDEYTDDYADMEDSFM